MNRAPLPLRDDERLIFALDVPDRAQALEWVDRLGDSVAFYKIGMASTSRCWTSGPAATSACSST